MSVHFRNLTDLSEKTQITYQRRLDLLEKMFDRDISLILCRPYHVYKYLRTRYCNWSTINSYIVPIHTIITRFPKISSKIPQKAKAGWLTISSYTKEQWLLHRISNINKQQIELTLADLISKLTKTTGRDKVILALYTLIPPSRSDYGKLKIVRDISAYQNNTENNILFLGGPEDSFIEIINYKTMKSYGRVRKKLSLELVEIIENYCQAEKIDDILFTKSNGEPYPNDEFSHLVTSTLTRIFAKHLTINHLRHIYITSNIELKTDSRKKLETAKAMCHSTATQVNYIWAQ